MSIEVYGGVGVLAVMTLGASFLCISGTALRALGSRSSEEPVLRRIWTPWMMLATVTSLGGILAALTLPIAPNLALVTGWGTGAALALAYLRRYRRQRIDPA